MDGWIGCCSTSTHFAEELYCTLMSHLSRLTPAAPSSAGGLGAYQVKSCRSLQEFTGQPVPVSARLCAHPWPQFVALSHCWQSVPSCQSQGPHPQDTMGAWLSLCSNGLLLMSRTHRDQHLFFICQHFNDMDSALIKAALPKLRPHL